MRIYAFYIKFSCMFNWLNHLTFGTFEIVWWASCKIQLDK